MGLYVIVGVLAAFGLLCALWVILGSALTKAHSLSGLCLCTQLSQGLAAAQRWLWLRDLGLVSGCMILVDCGLTPVEKEYLQSISPWVKICDRDLLSLSELERTERD